MGKCTQNADDENAKENIELKFLFDLRKELHILIELPVHWSVIL